MGYTHCPCCGIDSVDNDLCAYCEDNKCEPDPNGPCALEVEIDEAAEASTLIRIDRLTETEFESAVVRALCTDGWAKANTSATCAVRTRIALSQTDAELLTGRLWGELGHAYDDNRTPADTAEILTGNLDPKHDDR